MQNPRLWIHAIREYIFAFLFFESGMEYDLHSIGRNIMESNGIAYRDHVVPADIEAIRTIVKSTGYFNAEELLFAGEMVEERILLGEKSGYEFLIAEYNGRVIGYSCFGRIPGTQSSFDLYWIVVHPEHSGKRIGKELMHRTEACIRAMKGARVYAETSSRRQYESTRAFYRSCGYLPEAVFEDFYGPNDAKIVFAKNLEAVQAARVVSMEVFALEQKTLQDGNALPDALSAAA
jgi:GNAT superfamily N-acetyltransferase